MDHILTLEHFAECFAIFDAVDQNLTFDEKTGIGTASKVWPNEDHGNFRIYNHLWTKFVEASKNSCRLLCQLDKHAGRIASYFYPSRNVTTHVLLTVAEVTQSAFSKPDIEAFASSPDRVGDLWDAYRPVEYESSSPVVLWNHLNDEERRRLYNAVIHKVVEYAVSRKTTDQYMPRYFTRRTDMLNARLFPLFDGDKEFIWCSFPVCDSWQQQDEGALEKLVYFHDNKFISYQKVDTDVDIFCFGLKGEQFVYSFGQLLESHSEQ